MTRRLDYPEIAFHGLLSRTAQHLPGKVALVFGDRRITYAELDRDVSRFAAALQDLGVRKGDRIGLYLPNCPEYEIGFLGAARAGVVPTPLNPSYKEREVAYQLGEAQVSALIVHHNLLPVVQAIEDDLDPALRIIEVGGSGSGRYADFGRVLAAAPEQPAPVDIAPGDVAALPFSSGTTGTSKGVMLTQTNLVCNALQFVDATASTADDVLLIFLPLYHIYGVSLIATAITCGATQILLPRFDLQEVVDVIGRERVTEVYVVPPVMLALANAPGLAPERFSTVRFAMSAAAPLAPDVARRVAERLHLRVIQAYGMTESSPLTHMVPLDAAYAYDHVGTVAADTECRIVDLDGGDTELPAGEVGEVVVRGPQVMAGYWNAPRETAGALRGGWLHTGDVGRVDAEGRLLIVDRKKEMIKHKAWSIAPAELEAVLLEHPAVADCAVTAEPDPEAGEIPHAYVVVREGYTALPTELMAWVVERVARYKQIRALDFVDAIPRTPSGKILRRVLRERASTPSH